MLISETLQIGGAETFVLRLSQALAMLGHSVSLFVLRGEKVNKKLVESLIKNVDVSTVTVHGSVLRLVLKLDGLLFVLGCSFSVLRWLQIRQVKKHLIAVDAEVVHSHLLTADLVTAGACVALGLPWVTTMHGDYEAFEKQGRNRAARILDFGRALSVVERSVAHMVCITAPQMTQLGRLLPRLASKGGISNIYNGYAVADGVIEGNAPAAIEHIPPDAFVIGMVARGIRDKGWEVLIAAFLEAQLPHSWLILVGDGDYLQQIRPSIQHPRIVFAGNVIDPLRYIDRFNVGCLPSWFKAESLPTVVIEYLYMGKPVIASNVGELSAMLDARGDAPAGLLIELDSVEEMVKQMKAALQQMYSNKEQREFLRSNTSSASKKFDMDQCVDAYLNVYKAAQA